MRSAEGRAGLLRAAGAGLGRRRVQDPDDRVGGGSFPKEWRGRPCRRGREGLRGRKSPVDLAAIKPRDTQQMGEGRLG